MEFKYQDFMLIENQIFTTLLDIQAFETDFDLEREDSNMNACNKIHEQVCNSRKLMHRLCQEYIDAHNQANNIIEID